MIADCPMNKKDSPKYKNYEKSNDYKKAMVAAIWGDSESEDEPEEEETKLCFTAQTVESADPVEHSLPGADYCLMAHD